MASDEPPVTIDGKRLTSFDVAPDGSLFRLNLIDAEDKAVSVALPTGCLNELLMTLPRIITQAMHAKYGDNSMRLVYALGDWRLETAAGDERLILTLRTTDGFDVAFADQDRAAAGAVERVPVGVCVRSQRTIVVCDGSGCQLANHVYSSSRG